MKSISSGRLNRQLKRDTVKATNEARISVSRIAGTVTISELR